MKTPNLKIRQAKESDFLTVCEFVSKCKPLEEYPEHLYKILLRYFNNTCFIAESKGELIGVALGFVSQAHAGRYFLWQIGILPKVQSKGIGSSFLKKIEEKMRQRGIKEIELTVDPQNSPSVTLFSKMDYENASRDEGKTVKINNREAAKDYYKPGRHFIVFRKKF
jgi:L-2,4-diaminobutyric acid acetyltransferase